MKRIRQLTGKKLLLLVVAAAFNFTVYWGARLLAEGSPHYNFTFPMDRIIPFVPWTILIYWGCYIFWILNYCLSAAGTRGSRFLAIVDVVAGILLAEVSYQAAGGIHRIFSDRKRTAN